MATASDKKFSIKLTEDDVPGAKFRSNIISEHSVIELKRWLQCRGLNTNGSKQELVERCRVCIEAGGAADIIVSIDEGRWYEQKVASVLQQIREDRREKVPLLPTTGWQDFPACTLSRGFCYGNIFKHIIASARTYNVNKNDSDSDSGDNAKDFGTSKPMIKGRQYFTSGHVKNIKHQMKGDHQFFKSRVMASYTIGANLYHVSVTLKCPSGNVLDATCDCKASSMGRCNHVASLLFAIEDYIMQFGYDVAPTDKICRWNQGRKNKRDPQACHSAQYNKKLKADRMIDFDPRLESTEDSDDHFVNNFIASLPCIQPQGTTMLEQVLEIDYQDYIADKEVLQKMTDIAIQNFYSSSTALAPYEIENTKEQGNSHTWHVHRSIRITASTAKEVANVETTRGKFHILSKHLWGNNLLELKALDYGRQHEKQAFEVYKNQQVNTNVSATLSGLWVNPKYPELASTPDGLLFDTNGKLIGVVEIKCPLVLEKYDPQNISALSPKQRYSLCYKVENGSMKIKRTHQYYFQVQMQMAICDVPICDFVIWSPKGILIERIERDTAFWDDLCPKLIDFHHKVLLPEYLEMRIPRKLMPVDLGQ